MLDGPAAGRPEYQWNGTVWRRMGCDCGEVSVRSALERRVVRTALLLNLAMFLFGLGAGLYGHSTSILADALDMLADATGYALALLAIRRSDAFRRSAARWTGGILILLGVGIIAEVVRRWILGSEPLGPVMVGYSILSVAVNLYVMVQLAKIREGGVHLNASYICTRVDVLANAGVFLAGILVWLTGWHLFDLLVGLAMAIVVFRESGEILEQASPPEGSR